MKKLIRVLDDRVPELCAGHTGTLVDFIKPFFHSNQEILNFFDLFRNRNIDTVVRDILRSS